MLNELKRCVDTYALPPLATQKKIADILQQADALRQQAKQMQIELDKLAQSIFIDMFGDPVTNPRKWPVKDVGKLTNCIVPSRDKPKSFSGEIPWVTTDKLIERGYLDKRMLIMGLSSSEIEEVNAKVIPENSVIMSCVGDLGLASINQNKVVINQQLHSYQCKDDILPEYLMFALGFQKNFMYLKATQTTLPYMNKSVCNSIPVITPPMELQLQFRDQYLLLNQNQKENEKEQVELETLFNSLMQRAFKGEFVT